MATFKALNIESDDESDIVVDDTKEIQIEEALRLYQTALRFHAEGPHSFAKAEKAYHELFASEIFTYPESQIELRRIEEYFPRGDVDQRWLDVDDPDLLSFSTYETGPSTLPQILHLSHKNYAQFKLESLAAQLDEVQASIQHILTEASDALDHFVAALDKDDTDADLWKKTAAVSSLLDSKRVARLCLEASLDSNDDGLSAVLQIPSFEDSMVQQQLTSLIDDLNDHLSSLQSAFVSSQKRVVLRHFKDNVDRFRRIVDKVLHARGAVQHAAEGEETHKLNVKAPTTWADLGDMLLSAQNDQELSGIGTSPSIWHFELVLESTPYLTPPQEAFLEDNSGSQPESQSTTTALFPTLIDQQFPGLDGGQPHAPIGPTQGQSKMDETRPDSAVSEDATTQNVRESSLPTRKRSGDAAGITENAEEGRSRSKRLKARDSTIDSIESKQALQAANAQWEYDQHLNETQLADDWLYETVGPYFERLGVSCFETIKDVKALLTPDTASPGSVSSMLLAQQAFFNFLQDYDDRLAQSMLLAGERMELIAHTRETNKDGIVTSTSTIQHEGVALVPDEALLDFLEAENEKHASLEDISADFVLTMTFPGRFPGLSNMDSSYIRHAWREKLKSAIARAIVSFDHVLYKHATDILETLLSHNHQVHGRAVRGWVQNMFELQLDVYSLVVRADSGVDAEDVALQAERLDRWFDVLQEVSRLGVHNQDDVEASLDIRYLWASTCYIAGLKDTPQDRALAFMQDLRRKVVVLDQPIKLVNNALMPELALSVLDHEISQLTTKDFFDKVSEMEESDPAALIETIEPLLEAVEIRSRVVDEADRPDVSSDSVPLELILFLENGSPTSIMQLWHRLLGAYSTIGYEPMVVRTLFRMMSLAISQIEDDKISDVAMTDRTASVLSVLRLIQRLTANILQTVQQSQDALDCLDESDLHHAVALFDKTLRLLQTFNVFEDPIRIGRNHAPTLPDGSSIPSFQQFSKFLHEMQLQVWTVLYGLLKEAVKQNKALFPTPQEDRFEFLRTLHRNLGIRLICGGLDRAFIKLLKDEFLELNHVDGYHSEQAQVLYDLYGLNCFLDPRYELMEHHCAHVSTIDHDVAHDAADLLLVQAERLSIKELVKHPLKDAIDEVHDALNRQKFTEAMQLNRDTVRDYLNSPINPIDIFRCFYGEGNQLIILPTPARDAILAAKGWYYLVGHLALTKFRTAKRTGPTPTEDIDIAIAFFMQELVYSVSNWETWFRMGQAYDTKLDESVAWSAEKLNNTMPDIIQYQRAVINCYTMAIALAFRSAKPSPDMADKMTELYTEFGMRIYSSSRPPFSMLVFKTDMPERYLSSRRGVEKHASYAPLTSYAACKLAKVLFQRAITGNPLQWSLHYHLAKCLWKMHTADAATLGVTSPPSIQDVLQALYRAIELLPSKKDTRDAKREPILEPHYKLVSLVHKLVLANKIELDTAKEALSHTSYARKVDFPEKREDWIEYVLAVLKNLRTADKANWHHRMIARVAHIMWDDEREASQVVRAANAKHELTQQLFTKTMVLQVWRPEAERPGRHFVYCARYVRFFIDTLSILKDRTSLDLLARRVRRRTHEIFEHSLVWQDIVTIYLRLLRAHAAVTEGLEISTFSNIYHEDFLDRKGTLEKWMQGQEPGKHTVLDVLRETLELKKINQTLMKTGPIDDLIGDLYAYLFNTIGKQLWDDEKREQVEREQDIPPEVKPVVPTQPAVAPPRNMMNLANLMNTVEVPTPEPTPAPEVIVEAETPVKKKTGVGRREIRTAADGCIYKAPSSSGSARHSISSDHVRASSAANKLEADAMSGDERDNSVPGSIVDDADDESELSELEEVGDDDTVNDGEANEGAVNGDEPNNGGAHEGDGAVQSSIPLVRPLFAHLANGMQVEDSVVGAQKVEEDETRMEVVSPAATGTADDPQVGEIVVTSAAQAVVDP